MGTNSTVNRRFARPRPAVRIAAGGEPCSETPDRAGARADL